MKIRFIFWNNSKLYSNKLNSNSARHKSAKTYGLDQIIESTTSTTLLQEMLIGTNRRTPPIGFQNSKQSTKPEKRNNEYDRQRTHV